MKFVFLLTFWTMDGYPPEVEAVATGLTGPECIAMLLDHGSPPNYGTSGSGSCEIDLDTVPQ